MRIRAVISEGRRARAKLFQAGFAIFADPIGVDQASNRAQIAFLKFFYVASDFDDPTNNFMTGHAGISGSAPFVARDVNVRMANAAI